MLVEQPRLHWVWYKYQEKNLITEFQDLPKLLAAQYFLLENNNCSRITKDEADFKENFDEHIKTVFYTEAPVIVRLY